MVVVWIRSLGGLFRQLLYKPWAYVNLLAYAKVRSRRINLLVPKRNQIFLKLFSGMHQTSFRAITEQSKLDLSEVSQ